MPGLLERTPDGGAIRADVVALAGMTRDSAGPGEREAAAWAAARLREAGVADVAIEPYRARATNSWSFAAHGAAGLIAGRVGGVRGAALALGTLISLERDVSGRAPWRRRLLGGGEGANVVARLPARGHATRTAVVVAHLDAARTGLAWHPRVNAFGAARAMRTRRADPVMGLQGAALLATAAAALGDRWRPVRGAGHAAASLHAAALALNLDIARSPTVPGANDNATGVAVALDLARALAADPLEHVDVLIALVGCEESGMGGFHAVLESHPLDPASAFVLGLDTLGCGVPIVAAGEGAMRTYRYAERDLALVDAGAIRAGEPPPQRWRIGAWTDPLLALTRGIPAASLLSIGPGYYPHYHHPSDRPEHVDWDSVAACARIAAGTLAELDA
jgi:hypothetical protein